MEHGVQVQAGGLGQPWEQLGWPECPKKRAVAQGAVAWVRGVAKHDDSALGKWLS